MNVSMISPLYSSRCLQNLSNVQGVVDTLNSYHFMVERIVDNTVMSSGRRTNLNWMAD